MKNLRVTLQVFFVALIVFLLLFGYSLRHIYTGVKGICHEYQTRFNATNCLDGLRASIESIETTIEEKNQAIWAISQLGREEALPYLYKLKQSEPCQPPGSTDGCLSELLLDRAINFSQSWTATKWMYKNL